MDEVLLRHRFLNQYLFSYGKSRLKKTTFLQISALLSLELLSRRVIGQRSFHHIPVDGALKTVNINRLNASYCEKSLKISKSKKERLKTIYCVTEWVQLVLQHCWQNQLNSDVARFISHELEGMSYGCVTTFLSDESQREVNFLHSSGQIISIRIKTLCNTSLVASRYIKWETGSLPVNVRRSKTSLRKLPKNATKLEK